MMSRGSGLTLDRDTPALVFKIGRYPWHHGGLAVVRSLGWAGVKVYAVVESRRVPIAASALLTGGFEWPTGRDNASGNRFVDATRAMAAHIGRPFVVIPTDDVAATLFNDHATELPDPLLLPRCTVGLARRLTDKASCADSAAGAGLTLPEAVILHCPVSTADLAQVPLPVVVKRPQAGLRPDGTRTFSTVIAEYRETLRQTLQDNTEGPYDVILQEVLPGDDWLYHGYCDATSTALVSFTGRKLRSRPPFAGETSYARTESNEELRLAVERFLRDIQYVGPISIDVRHDPRTGAYRLLDANPRVGACFRLFVTDRNVDVVRAMHLDLTGREVPPGRQVDGRTYLVENYDLTVRRSYGLSGFPGAVSWLGTLWHADERAWLQRGDLLPAAVARVRPRVVRPSGMAEHIRPRYFRGRNHASATSDTEPAR
jgi:D-aspartate ligase